MSERACPRVRATRRGLHAGAARRRYRAGRVELRGWGRRVRVQVQERRVTRLGGDCAGRRRRIWRAGEREAARSRRLRHERRLLLWREERGGWRSASNAAERKARRVASGGGHVVGGWEASSGNGLRGEVLRHAERGRRGRVQGRRHEEPGAYWRQERRRVVHRWFVSHHCSSEHVIKEAVDRRVAEQLPEEQVLQTFEANWAQRGQSQEQLRKARWLVRVHAFAVILECRVDALATFLHGARRSDTFHFCKQRTKRRRLKKREWMMRVIKIMF